MAEPRRGRTLKPQTYLVLGVALFLIKFVIDRLVAAAFGRGWSFMNYLVPSEVYTLPSLPPQERGFYLIMLAVALPFIYVGLSLTWWRLHDAALPRWLVVLFFVPAVNLVFFTVLGFWPSRPGNEAIEAEPVSEDRWAPGPFASFILAAVSGAAAGGLCIVTGVLVFREYGWGAFVAAPFVSGMCAAWLHGYWQPRSTGESLGAASLTLLMAGLALLVIAIEGAICLLMAAPLAFMVAMLGGILGHVLAMDRHRHEPPGRGFEVLPAMSIPLLLMSAEFMEHRAPPVHRVTTSVIIDAPAEKVWANVVSFPELPPARHWIFRTGIAYPISAHIDGAGVGAIRHCNFSTGAFVEPITHWQPPATMGAQGLLRFDVIESPPPLKEWSWTGIDPPHLDGFLVSQQGQFRLIPLADGRTRLEGSTWYAHAISPDIYWRFWSDWIVGRIHVEVLEHIKSLTEAP